MPTPAKISIDTNRIVSDISPLLFGGFAEHMGRCIYEGIYDPKSPHADEDGLRKDVMTLLKEQGYTVLRYPGGNFLSGYNWLDGVGPKEQRPRRRELAWQSIETNQFGTDEFMKFCTKTGIAPMLGVNLGTGNIEGTASLVEYCNAPTGTYYADLRAKNGHPEPYNVKYWCIGNEMDGPWQIGHLDINEYANKAREAAKMMKWHDPNVKLVLCGSSNDRMPTFPEWDRVALDTCWDQTDYLSIHYYATNHEDDTPSYLALASRLEAYVDTLAGTIRHVKAKHRSKRNVYLSWDEWQVWYKDRSGRGNWTEAPHLSEEIYNLEDALVVGQWLNVFLRKADVLKIACVAQIVNVISWLHTRADGVLVQPSFWPFKWVSNNARGNALDVLVQSPHYETQQFGDQPVLDVSASHDPATGKSALFIVNRSLSETQTTDVTWQGDVPKTVGEAYQLAGADPKAANTWENPKNVMPKQLKNVKIEDGKMRLRLPPLSFTAITLR